MDQHAQRIRENNDKRVGVPSAAALRDQLRQTIQEQQEEIDTLNHSLAEIARLVCGEATPENINFLEENVAQVMENFKSVADGVARLYDKHAPGNSWSFQEEDRARENVLREAMAGAGYALPERRLF